VRDKTRAIPSKETVVKLLTLRSVMFGLPLVALAACGGFDSLGPSAPRGELPQNIDDAPASDETIWNLFDGRDDPNTTVEVNKYIWNAALDILDFMPVEAVDPFTGVIVMGYGTAPGSSRAYRATVYVQDPALDARSLRVALATRSGPASADTVLAVEDAILTRARQLRLQDKQL
jgi:hypothetical protein